MTVRSGPRLVRPAPPGLRRASVLDPALLERRIEHVIRARRALGWRSAVKASLLAWAGLATVIVACLPVPHRTAVVLTAVALIVLAGFEACFTHTDQAKELDRAETDLAAQLTLSLRGQGRDHERAADRHMRPSPLHGVAREDGMYEQR